MIPEVENLAQLMRAKRDDGKKFVLMLGAGASMSSGVKRTPVIMEELLQKFGQGIEGASVEDRFDQLWQNTPRPDRGMFLKPYLDLDIEPSPGYGKLARLIEKEYFDLVLTFNFDDLLETALRAIQFMDVRDFRVIIRGEHRDEEMENLADAKEPRFKLAKLHGSLGSTDHFLFNSDEMYRYPDPIEALVKKITRNDVIVCGYAFNDECVRRAFSEQGGYVVCVNPSGVPRDLRHVVKTRLSEDRGIAADFDTFFDELHRALLQPPVPADEKPLPNPFKFLESYDEADRDSFLGRAPETEKFFRQLEAEPQPRVIVVAGAEKAGKTSLVRACLLAGLDAQKYQGVYLRCQPKLAESLPRDLARHVPDLGQQPLDLAGALQRLGEASRDRRVVLFLDQFDRVTHHHEWPTKAAKPGLSAFLKNELFKGCNENLTLVLVVIDKDGLGGWLLQECQDAHLAHSLVQCDAFDRQEVVDIIQSLAQKGGFAFDPKIIAEMADCYDRTRNAPAQDKRFTLAHIQTVCHILASARNVNYASYKRAFSDNLDALNRAINVRDDIVSFLEDFSWPDVVWLRNMIKVPLTKSKEGIAEFIMAHYNELLPRRDTAGSQGHGSPDAARR